jgi:hypothetical protein
MIGEAFTLRDDQRPTYKVAFAVPYPLRNAPTAAVGAILDLHLKLCLLQVAAGQRHHSISSRVY